MPASPSEVTQIKIEWHAIVLRITLTCVALILAALLSIPIAVEALSIHFSSKTRQCFELCQLNLVVESYRIEFGNYPPDSESERAIVHHLRTILESDHRMLRFFRSAPGSIRSLDDSELLVFYLDVVPGFECDKTDSRFVPFPFDRNRLCDHDGDGWLEYVDIYGNTIVIRGGEIFGRDRKTGDLRSANSY